MVWLTAGDSVRDDGIIFTVLMWVNRKCYCLSVCESLTHFYSQFCFLFSSLFLFLQLCSALRKHKYLTLHWCTIRSSDPHQQETSSFIYKHSPHQAPFFFFAPFPSFLFCVLFGLLHFDWLSHVARLPNDWPVLLMTSSLGVLGSIAVWRNEIRLGCMSLSQPCKGVESM